MKRLAIVGRNLGAGGNQRSASNISVALDDDYDLYYIVFDSSNAVTRYKGKLIDIQASSSDSVLVKIKNNIRRIIRIKRVVKRNKIDILYTFLETGNVINFCNFGNKCKRIASCRDYRDLSQNTGAYKKMIDAASGAIFNSRYMRDFYCGKYPEDKDKVFAVYNIVNVDYVKEKAKEELDDRYKELFETGRVIVAVGRLCADKGFNHLIRAFEIYKNNGGTALLAIMGEGDEGLKLKEMANTSRYKDDIVFLGNQSNPYKYMKKASLFVLSSNNEGFPNVIIEAMACGLPVVSANCKTGPSEILCKEYDYSDADTHFRTVDYGILTPAFKTSQSYELNVDDSGAAEEMAKAIEYILSNEDVYKMYREKSKERCCDFSQEKIKKELIYAITKITEEEKNDVFV